MIVAGTAAVIALLFGLLSDIESHYLGLYVAGSMVVTAFASYMGFWTRASNWHELVHAFVWIAIAMACFGVVKFVHDSAQPATLYWLLAVFAALTAVVRLLAKRKLADIDWCAVRPARMRKKNA